MIHWQTVKEFFGFGTTTAVDETAGHSWSPPPAPRPLTEGNTLSVVKNQSEATRPTSPPPAARPPIKKTSLRARNYYRRNGRFYSSIDDGLIEDVLMLIAIQELFDDGDIREYEEPVSEVVAEPAEDLLDVDVSETPVAHWNTIESSAPETRAYDTEPVRQDYSSGYSDSGCSSSSDSGSSDCGGSDD